MAPATIPSNGDSCRIDVPKLFGEIWASDDVPFQCKRSEVCIFRVPKFLKDLNEKAYVPQMLSLGPLHDVNKQLSVTKADKMRAVVRMLRRCPLLTEIEDVIRKIRDLEMKIKDCYEVAIHYEGDDLAWMLTLDGCFILEILRAATSEFPISESFEPIFDGKRLGFLQGFSLLRDIMLLENQIPLVVLIRLLELELGATEKAQDKLCEVLNDHRLENLIPFTYNSGEGESQKAIECQLEDIRNSKHLLDLLRTRIISSFLRPVPKGILNNQNNSSCVGRFIQKINRCSRPPHDHRYSPISDTVPSAEILQNAGIQFRRCGREQTHIRFEKKTWISGSATLFLPTIEIYDNTETILRNLIAYEECRAESHNRISRYALLMDNFIESKEDVGILKKAGIIVTGIGSDKEVATLFNRLCKGITENEIDEIDKIVAEIKEHYENKWKVWLAELVEMYCSNPWLFISLVAGTMLLVMTLLQTVFTIIYR